MHVLTFLPRNPRVSAKIGMIVRAQNLAFRECATAEEVLEECRRLSSGAGGRVFLLTEYTDVDIVRTLSAERLPVAVALLIEDRLQELARGLVDCLSVPCLVVQQSDQLEPRDVVTMLRKLSDANIVGLEKYLGFGTAIEERLVCTPEDKAQAIVTVANFVARIGGEPEQKRYGEYARRVSELVDELVLNALFDANPALKDVNRSERFSLEQREAVHVRWGFDGEIFGVSVRDPFGNLKKETVLHYLDESAPNEVPVHERKSAGLGIRLVFERMHQFVVNIKPGQMTEVICLLRFEKRFRDFEARLKSFHYYTV